ncbi:Cell division coordinator CpoB [Alphaproteobacteria bacterium]
MRRLSIPYIIGAASLICAYSVTLSFATEGYRPPQIIDNAAQSRLDSLERSVSALQKYAYNVSSINAGNQSFSTESAGVVNMDDIIAQFKAIRGELEKLEYITNKLNDKLAQMSADFGDRIAQLEKGGTSPSDNKDLKVLNNIGDILDEQNKVGSDGHALDKGETTTSSKKVQEASADSKNAQDAYQNAYNVFRSGVPGTKESYSKAKEVFEKFIEQYPSNVLVGNARYWLGSMYAGSKDYDKAAIEHLKGYKANSSGGRAADNLLGLGQALLNLGNTKEACTTFEKLQSEFPGISSSTKREIGKLKQKAGCTLVE